MFAWFVSLLMLFSNRGIAPTAPSVGLNGSGNLHTQHADETGSNPQNPANVDGKGAGGGGTGGGGSSGGGSGGGGGGAF